MTEETAKALTEAMIRLATAIEKVTGPFGLTMHHTGIPAPYTQPLYQPAPIMPDHWQVRD